MCDDSTTTFFCYSALNGTTTKYMWKRIETPRKTTNESSLEFQSTFLKSDGMMTSRWSFFLFFLILFFCFDRTSTRSGASFWCSGWRAPARCRTSSTSASSTPAARASGAAWRSNSSTAIGSPPYVILVFFFFSEIGRNRVPLKGRRKGENEDRCFSFLLAIDFAIPSDFSTAMRSVDCWKRKKRRGIQLE